MQYRRFGRTGVSVSAIGYGGWGIGGSSWGRRNDRRSRASLELALDLGINFFDTAYVYGNGHSESLIGEVIARRRARGGVYLATKIPPCGFRIDASRNTFAHAYPRRWIRSATE